MAAGRRSIDPKLAVAALDHSGSAVTEREVALAQLLAEGLHDSEIAHRMSLSHGTVRNYLSVLMSKVDARDRVDLVRIGQEDGWLLPRRRAVPGPRRCGWSPRPRGVLPVAARRRAPG